MRKKVIEITSWRGRGGGSLPLDREKESTKTKTFKMAHKRCQYMGNQLSIIGLKMSRTKKNVPPISRQAGDTAAPSLPRASQR